jgi:hypothetical protein
VRPIIDMINYTFGEALELGPKLSVDEATIASHSTYLPARMYNPMKPHKYGLKVFMLCDAQNGFCAKLEIYQGKRDTSDDAPGTEDMTCGPHAVIRLVRHLRGSFRTVYCDRFYTTMLLVLHLLTLGKCHSHPPYLPST